MSNVAVDEVHSALKAFNKVIDDVLKFPAGPKRWRAAHDLLWLRISPKNKQIYKEVVEENRQIRDSLGAFNQYATSKDKNSGLRSYLNIPTGAYYVIQRADPDAFRLRKNAKRMFDEFKEYRTAEVY